MAKTTPARTEFSSAIAQIASERNITVEAIHDAIKQALVSAYKKQVDEYDEESYYFSHLDEFSGESKIFKCPVTKRDEET